jgi:hypothetical protein
LSRALSFDVEIPNSLKANAGFCTAILGIVLVSNWRYNLDGFCDEAHKKYYSQRERKERHETEN